MKDEGRNKLFASFDQAVARGLPARNIIAGLARKFDLRHGQVVDALIETRRIHAINAAGGTLFWAVSPAQAAARNVERQTELDLIQAGIDYALSQGMIDPEELQNSHPDKIRRLVAQSLWKESRDGGTKGDNARPEAA